MRDYNAHVAFCILPTVLLLIGLASCDVFGLGGRGLSEGQELEVESLRSIQPNSREAYADLPILLLPGRLVFFEPGTGVEDPPEVIRTVRIPDVVTIDAQTDRDGFVWIATPYASQSNGGSTLSETYVVDPHEGRVHRVIGLPRALRAAAGVFVGEDQVYYQSWQDGFGGALGTVSLQCIEDGSQCGAEVLSDFENVGGTPTRSLVSAGDVLYSARGSNSRDRFAQYDRIDMQSGTITATRIDEESTGADLVVDGGGLFARGYFEPGINTLARLDPLTLETLEATELENAFETAPGYMAVEGGVLYLAGRGPTIQVRSAETLAVLGSVDISAASKMPSNNFGFVAPGLIMLNERDFVDVRTGEVLTGVFPFDEVFGITLRFPAGHPLAD